jgi:hypothetical protein
MAMDVRHAFAVLELQETATLDELRVAYRDLVKVWHPDRFVNDPRLQAKAAETFCRINEANETLRRYLATSREQPLPRQQPSPPREQPPEDHTRTPPHERAAPPRKHTSPTPSPTGDRPVPESPREASAGAWTIWGTAAVILLSAFVVARWTNTSTGANGASQASSVMSTHNEGKPSFRQWFEDNRSTAAGGQVSTELPGSVVQVPTERGLPTYWRHASSHSELVFRMVGAWVVNGTMPVVVRDGSVERSDRSALIGYYDPDTVTR